MSTGQTSGAGAEVPGVRSDGGIVVRTQGFVGQRLVRLRQFRRRIGRNVLELVAKMLHLVGVILGYLAAKCSPDFIGGRSRNDAQQLVMARPIDSQPQLLDRRRAGGRKFAPGAHRLPVRCWKLRA